MGLRHLDNVGVTVTRWLWAVTDVVLAVHADVAKLILQGVPITSYT